MFNFIHPLRAIKSSNTKDVPGNYTYTCDNMKTLNMKEQNLLSSPWNTFNDKMINKDIDIYDVIKYEKCVSKFKMSR